MPLTKEGNILVDGVLASCYASAAHDVSDLGVTPMRWFPNIIEWIFGDDNEYQGYIKIAKELGNWVKLYWQKYNK